MIVNVAYPRNGTQKIWKLDDEKLYSRFYDHKIGQELEADFIAPEFKGYTLKITGGSDKNGFCMKQGVNTKSMARLLLSKGSVGYFCKRKGVRKRRTVRGCIIGPGIAAVNCIISKKGEGEVAGLTDKNLPRRLGPKRANKIRKLFNLPRHSDNIGKKNPTKVKVNHQEITALIVKKEGKTFGDKKFYKAPKIQRLVTTLRIRRKVTRRKNKLAAAIENKKAIETFNKKKDVAEVKKDDKKPEVKKDDKKPEAKKDDKKPEAKKDDKKPEAKKDDKKPEAKKDDKKPEAKKDDKKPETKKDDKKPDAKKDGKK